jgi:undecaprenyl diphosphate synthase
MDGNGRWATNRGWPRLVGHRKGAERVREIVRAAPTWASEWLTLYAFSTENWKRSTEEVLGLMAIFARYIEREADELAKCRGADALHRRPQAAGPQAATPDGGDRGADGGNDRLNLTVAINYGGRDEITARGAPDRRGGGEGIASTPPR